MLLLFCLIILRLSFIYTGQFTDDNKTIRRIQQQQQRSIHTDDENISIGMFQANYQYTPLKEYAAMRNGRTMNDTSTNSYQSK